MIIGLVGLIGSGKDTAADILVNFYGFRRDSFANTLKDAVSSIFGWDRELLEGRTTASREWREQVDSWWADRLNIPNLTPRMVLQVWGTEVCRNNFHNDIWIASLENKLRKTTDDIVITDCRFINEINAIKQSGGRVHRIIRGQDPEWYKIASDFNYSSDEEVKKNAKQTLAELKIHPSEYSWAGTAFDSIIDNNGTIQDLYNQIKNLV